MPPHTNQGEEITLALLNQKLDTVVLDMGEMKRNFSSHYELKREFDIYKTKTEGRLEQGNERMARIEKDAAIEHANCTNEIKRLNLIVEELPKFYVERKVMLAYLAGVATVGGIGGGFVGYMIKAAAIAAGAGH